MPIILERCIFLDIGPFLRDFAKLWAAEKLKKGPTAQPVQRGLAMPGGIWLGSVRWGVNDEETGSIGYRFNANPYIPSLTLIYSIDGQDVTQTVWLEAVPSNLHRGQYWLFICPVSGRRCKKLHLIRGLFQHRTALPGVFYRQQARTKWAFGRYLDAHFVMGELWEAAEAPYFREYYAGKLTRRSQRMLRKLKKWGPRMSDAEGLRILRGDR